MIPVPTRYDKYKGTDPTQGDRIAAMHHRVHAWDWPEKTLPNGRRPHYIERMPQTHPRIARGKKTVEAMIRMYCRGFHSGGSSLCPDCEGLMSYASERLDRCPFQEGKTACVKCPVHCYKPAMREKIRKVMRYAGPRMLWRQPVYALFHYLDGLRKEPLGQREKQERKKP